MIFAWNIHRLFNDEYRARLLPYLDEQRLLRVERYKNAADKARCVGAGVLLAQAYRAYLSAENTKPCMASDSRMQIYILQDDFLPAERIVLPQMQTNAYHKPMFTGADEPYFSLSHAGEYVLCAMENVPVGIDVERVRHAKEPVIRRSFDESEQQLLQTCRDEDEKNRLFTELWTQKEAAGKLDGRGIAAILNKDEDWMENVQIESAWLDEEYVFSKAVAQGSL